MDLIFRVNSYNYIMCTAVQYYTVSSIIHSVITDYSTAFKCRGCDSWYHHYCKNLVPYNCGVKDFLDSIVEVCMHVTVT